MAGRGCTDAVCSVLGDRGEGGVESNVGDHVVLYYAGCTLWWPGRRK